MLHGCVLLKNTDLKEELASLHTGDNSTIKNF